MTDSTSHHTDGDGEPLAPPEAQFKVLQKVYARDEDGLLYSAVIRRSLFGRTGIRQCRLGYFTHQESEDMQKLLDEEELAWHYFVHFDGWNVKWDRWVLEDNIFRHDNPVIRKYVERLSQEHKTLMGSMKKKRKKKSYSPFDGAGFLHSWRKVVDRVDSEMKVPNPQLDLIRGVSRTVPTSCEELTTGANKDEGAMTTSEIGPPDAKRKGRRGGSSRGTVRVSFEQERILRDKGLTKIAQNQTSTQKTIVLPYPLRKVLVDQWEIICQCNMVSTIPAPITIRQALNQYVQSKGVWLEQMTRQQVSDNKTRELETQTMSRGDDRQVDNFIDVGKAQDAAACSSSSRAETTPCVDDRKPNSQQSNETNTGALLPPASTFEVDRCVSASVVEVPKKFPLQSLENGQSCPPADVGVEHNSRGTVASLSRTAMDNNALKTKTAPDDKVKSTTRDAASVASGTEQAKTGDELSAGTPRANEPRALARIGAPLTGERQASATNDEPNSESSDNKRSRSRVLSLPLRRKRESAKSRNSSRGGKSLPNSKEDTRKRRKSGSHDNHEHLEGSDTTAQKSVAITALTGDTKPATAEQTSEASGLQGETKFHNMDTSSHAILPTGGNTDMDSGPQEKLSRELPGGNNDQVGPYHDMERQGQQRQEWIEMADGIAMFFDEALENLLYREEIAQLRGIQANPTFENVSYTELYGTEYLLRLFVRLPQILHENLSPDDSRPILAKINDLVRFLNKNQAKLFALKHERQTSP